MIAQRPRLFAAAVICCGGVALDSAAAAVSTPLWNFHGDADDTVPVKLSRDRIAALRKAGGHPLSTEYSGVGHNVWQWAYTEPSLVRWMFSKRRSA
jgi:predicted peptidase